MIEDESRMILRKHVTSTRVAVGLGALVALLLPFIAGSIAFVPYRSVFKGLTFAFGAIGVAMLLRHLNLVSFGHAVFFGAGAYAVAVCASQLEISNLFILLLLSVLVSTIMGVLIGFLVRSHLGIFFGLLTLAINQIIYSIVTSLEFFNFSDGIGVRIGGDRPDLFGLQLELAVYDLFMHYVTVALLFVGLYCAWRISNSPFGRTISAIGQDRVRAEFVGIDVERYVLLTFVITSIYAGIGGGLFALFELHVRPDPTLNIFRSGEMLFMAILGGIETIAGPVFGSIILRYLLDTVHVFTEHFDLLIGIILIGIVFLLPKGIVGVDYGAAIATVRNDPTVLYTWVKARF